MICFSDDEQRQWKKRQIILVKVIFFSPFLDILCPYIEKLLLFLFTKFRPFRMESEQEYSMADQLCFEMSTWLPTSFRKTTRLESSLNSWVLCVCGTHSKWSIAAAHTCNSMSVRRSTSPVLMPSSSPVVYPFQLRRNTEIFDVQKG